MAYRKVFYTKSNGMPCVEKLEGETIEQKMERVIDGGEPIEDGAPEIFTERKDGVISAYNIRTDRWEVACEAMDTVSGSIAAKRENKGQAKMEIVDEPKNGTTGVSEA
jgi:hypothetical protein